jgi:2-polyprenyl-6-methoxyphenol hydroxylase-like FAD-dependent oxidoreductase
MRKIPVLIIGAGPTGLMMASQLAIQEVPFLIVDKDPAATTESRAIGLQARSMEIFSQMGIVDKFLEGGYIAKGVNFVAKGKVRAHVPLASFGQNLTKYPFVFMHEQSKTEKNFIDFLKKYDKHITYDTEVVSLTEKDEEIEAVLKHDGKEETITAMWVIGADGAHSLVRHTLGIPFAGKTYKQSLFVMDCKVETDLPTDELTAMFSEHSFAAVFPMANHRWRIVGQLPDELNDKEEITFEEIEKDFAKRMQVDMKLSDCSWISLYHSHHRCVSTFQKGNFFLLGDAAHIHSPVGAQGMNTGLQDAYNLAWKLAFVYKKLAPPNLLKTMTQERIVFAHKLVHTVDRLFSIVVAENRLERNFRLYIAPKVIHFLVKHKKTSNFLFRTISQIGINYRHGPLAKDASSGKFPKDSPQPGDRLPYVLYEGNKNIQDLITPQIMHLLVFSDKEKDVQIIHEAMKPYSEMIKITTLPFSDETKELYKRFGTKQGFYLVRPDMYIACRSNNFDMKNLATYLSRYFINQT